MTPPDDEHVVPTPQHFAHPTQGARAVRDGWGERGDVPGSVAQQRHPGLGQRGEHQFPRRPVRHRPPVLVDRLHQEVILGNVQHPLPVKRFTGHSRPDDLAQPVDVQRPDPSNSSIWRRIPSVQGSAPNTPTLNDDCTPLLRRASQGGSRKKVCNTTHPAANPPPSAPAAPSSLPTAATQWLQAASRRDAPQDHP